MPKPCGLEGHVRGPTHRASTVVCLVLRKEEKIELAAEIGPYNSTIIALSGAKKWASAMDVLQRMRRVYKFEPHLFAVNSLINAS